MQSELEPGVKLCRTCNSTRGPFEEGRRVCTPCRYKQKAADARITRRSRGLKQPGQKPRVPWSKEAHEARKESARLRMETGLNKWQRDYASYKDYFDTEEEWLAAVERSKQLAKQGCHMRARRVLRNPDNAGIRV